LASVAAPCCAGAAVAPLAAAEVAGTKGGGEFGAAAGLGLDEWGEGEEGEEEEEEW